MRNGTRRTVISPALAEIQQALANVDTVPDGWKTREQWQAEWDCGSATANHVLTAMVKAGKVDVKKFRLPRGAYRAWPVPHYRLV